MCNQCCSVGRTFDEESRGIKMTYWDDIEAQAQRDHNREVVRLKLLHFHKMKELDREVELTKLLQTHGGKK